MQTRVQQASKFIGTTENVHTRKDAFIGSIMDGNFFSQLLTQSPFIVGIRLKN